MYTIMVVGAGYVGSAIARSFRLQKQKVIAVTHGENRKQEFEREDITHFTADVTRSETLATLPPAHFFVMALAPHEHDVLSYRQVYLEGLKNFLESRRNKMRPSLMVWISSTSVWRDRAGAWVDETVPPDADSEKGKILIEAEETILNSGYPSMVLRLAGIYGPGRNRIQAIQTGSWPKPDESDSYMNLIHRDDIVQVMPFLFKHGEVGQIYTGVDDEPVKRSELSGWLCHKLGKPEIPVSTNPVQGKRCSNKKLKELGYSFLYPNFRDGYAEFL